MTHTNHPEGSSEEKKYLSVDKAVEDLSGYYPAPTESISEKPAGCCEKCWKTDILGLATATYCHDKSCECHSKKPQGVNNSTPEWESRFWELTEEWGGGAHINYATHVRDLFRETLTSERTKIREMVLKELSGWVDNNIGVSSRELFMYMAGGEVPRAFHAPSDSGDRARCVALLNAVPEWKDRLKEIENLHIQGTLNGVKVEPWNEQIPLIRADLTALQAGDNDKTI